MKNITRRCFLYVAGATFFFFSFFRKKAVAQNMMKETVIKGTGKNNAMTINGETEIYLSKNGSPEQNTRKVIELMGGIERLISPDDIVLLKPNAQWWAQGTTNTNSMMAVIEMILEIKDFSGEIIIADNHHFPEKNSRAWNTQTRNGDFNLNELIEHFNKRGHHNVTKYHWTDGGPTIPNMWGGASMGGIVKGPEEGDGYIWRDDLVFTAPNGRKAMMSYPCFTSEYSGIRIDFCKGPWKDGKYLNRKLKMINFAALNHHGAGVGVTASIKNFLGICDMTCGERGTGPEGYYNFHYIGLSNIHWRIKGLLNKLGWRETMSSIGGCVGYFMRTVRKPDLNIITADWTGYGSRTDAELKERTRTIIASTDPVALDYIAGKEIIQPVTLKNAKGSDFELFNDPDNPKSPFRKFLIACNNEGIGTLDENKIKIIRYDFNQQTKV